MRILTRLRRLATVRRFRRACFASAALILLLAAFAPTFAKAADDPDADRPVAWNGDATSAVVQGQVDRKTGGVLPTAQTFFAAFPDAHTQWDPNTANARASTFYPGPTGTQAIPLICEQALPLIFGPNAIPVPLSTFDPICKPPVKFPTVAIADYYKGNPDARVDGSEVLGSAAPLTIYATSGVAHADRRSAYADGVIGSVNLVGPPLMASSSLSFRRHAAAILRGPVAAAAEAPSPADNTVLHIDAAVAHTKQVYDTAGALVVTATSSLQGVSLVGGAIHIASIDSTATSRTDGRGIATHDEHFTLGGVTVSGQPAAIDETGVHVGGSSNSAQPLTDALNTAFASVGLKITLASTSGSAKLDDYKAVESHVQGLIIDFERYLEVPENNDTYFAILTLGVAHAVAGASSDRGSAADLEEGGIGGLSTPSAPSDIAGTPGEPASSFEIPGTPGSAGTSGSGSVGRSGTASVLGARRAGVLDQLESELTHRRLDLVYIGFTLAFVGVCLSSRLLVPRARRIS